MTVDLSGGFGEDLEYVFPGQPTDPEMRESVNAWVWDSKGRVGLPRVGVEALADQWDTHDVQANIAARRRSGLRHLRTRASSRVDRT